MFSITAATLCGILSIRFCIVWLSIFSQSSWSICQSSSLFFGKGLCVWIFLSNMPHRFSIGFRSGFCAGQGRLVMSFSLFQSFTIRAVWIGALSSWKISYIFLLCKLIKYWVLDFFEIFIIQFDSQSIRNQYLWNLE